MTVSATAAMFVAVLAFPASADPTVPGRPSGGDIGVMFDCGNYPSNQPMSRTDVLARSKTWLDARVPYSQAACHANQHGSYRTDCSGFVSLAWGLRRSYTTSDIHLVSHEIARADLQPGDALNDPGSHVALFLSWADAAHTRPLVREQAGPNGSPTVERVWSAATASIYTPIRYDNIVDAPPSTGDVPGAMWHQIRNAEGTAWSGFAPIAGAGTTQHGAAKDVSIAGMSDGSAQALIVGSDDTVYHQIRNSDNLTWTGFSAVAGAGTSVPAKAKRASIAAMPDGSSQVVIIGADGKVYHQIRNADNLTWSGFQPVSGAGTNVAAGAKDVAITGMPNGDAHLVIIGDDDTVYHTIRTAAGPTWTGFGALSGAGTSVPAKGKRVSVAGMPDGSAQVLMTSTDNTVYHTIRNADGQSWSGFSAVSGAGTNVPAKGTDVAITAMPNGDAQVLITSEDDTVYHQIRTAAGPAWTGFSAVSGAGTAQGARAHKVSIAGMPDNSAQVFIVGK